MYSARFRLPHFLEPETRFYLQSHPPRPPICSDFWRALFLKINASNSSLVVGSFLILLVNSGRACKCSRSGRIGRYELNQCVSARQGRKVSNAALANAALVLSSKIGKNIQDGGQRRKINPKSLGSVFSLCCRRAGIDAALVKADFFFAGVPTIEIKLNKKIKNTKVASAKVAFDTVRQGRVLCSTHGYPPSYPACRRYFTRSSHT